MLVKKWGTEQRVSPEDKISFFEVDLKLALPSGLEARLKIL